MSDQGQLDPRGYPSREVSMDIGSYDSPSDRMDSVDERSQIGPIHGSPTRPQTGDRTLRKGPFVYRE